MKLPIIFIFILISFLETQRASLLLSEIKHPQNENGPLVSLVLQLRHFFTHH